MYEQLSNAANRGDQGTLTRILVLNDVEETRDGIVALLSSDGYLVDPARNEVEAEEKARRNPPQAILLSHPGSTENWIALAQSIRSRAGLGSRIPAILFDVDTIPEGAEVHAGENVYLVRSDNFNQIRRLLASLVGVAK